MSEVKIIFKTMNVRPALACTIIYGTGMRINELVTLRVKDIDLSNESITIRNPKGNQSRVVFLPKKLHSAISKHLIWRKQLHVNDLGYIPLPNAFKCKSPLSQTRFAWQYAFPSTKVRKDHHEAHVIQRWHTSSSTIRKALQKAARECDINKRVVVHTLRHSFRYPFMQTGTDIRTI